MSLMWMGDEVPKAKGLERELTAQERAQLQRAEVYASIVIIIVMIAFIAGLIIGSYHHAAH